MKTVVAKFSDKIVKKLSNIQRKEGLNSRTSTIVFLVKYYELTSNSLEQNTELLNKILERLDIKNLPSIEEQLRDI